MRFKTERAAAPRLTKRQRRAIDRGTRLAKLRVLTNRAEARRRHFGRDPVSNLRVKIRGGEKALSELQASDPEGYARRRQEANDTKLLGRVNVEKAGRDANRALLKGAEAAKDFLRDSRSADQQMGLAPDSSKISTEILDIVANAPSGAYLTGAAAAEVIKGDPRRAKRLWQDFKDTSAVSAAVSGNWKEAAKRAQERPVTTALELSGGKALVGRGGGAVARRAPIPRKGFRRKVRQIGSTERANLRLYPRAKPGEGPEIQRRYSKDIINKGLQVAAERNARRRGRDPNVDYGSRASVGLTRRMGGSVVPGAVSHSRLVKRADDRVFSQDRVAQRRKARAEREVRKILRGHRKTTAPGVQLVAEGAVRISQIRRDLRRELGRLAKARQELKDPLRVRLNRQQAKQIRQLLALPDEKLARIVEASQALGRQQAPVQARGRRAGTWDEGGQAARLYPFLQSHVRRLRGEERRHYTPEEARAGAKSVMRRLRRGQEVPEHLVAQAAMRARKRQPGELIPEQLVSRRPRVGEAQYLHRSDIAESLLPKTVAGRVAGRKRRVAVASRPLNESELWIAARTAQRQYRRGRTPFSGTIAGGPVLITHRPGRGPMGARLRPSAPLEPMRSRSGRAFEEGSREVGREAILRQAVGAESEVTAAEGFQLLDREFGIAAGENGRRYAQSHSKAQERARALTLDPETGDPLPDSIPLVPVNIAQFQTFGPRLRAKQEQGMPRGYSATNDMERSVLSETWEAALAESGRGKWVLMPEEVVARLREHASVSNFGPLHSLTNAFKDVVLTTSSPARWVGGNVTDITMRTGFAGVTPIDVARGRMIVRRAREQGLQGEQATAAITGGLYHASDALNRSRRPAGEHENPARTILAAPWRTWKGGVYALEQLIEDIPTYGRTGKAMREESGFKALTKAPAAQVQRATPEQFGRAVQRAEKDAGAGYLSSYTAEDYVRMELYLAPDGKSGAAIRQLPGGDRELVNLFARKGAQYRGSQVLESMMRRGANRLDATSVSGGGLEKFYSKRGWKTENVEPWDPRFGPPPTPNARVVFMVRDTKARRYQDIEMKRDLKSLLRIHDAQIDNFAYKLATDRAFEARIQKLTEDVIGRWGKVSPNMRRALLVAPFVQWLRAATRYVFVTLPVHHPIKTGILAGIMEMTEEERQKLGLSYFLPRQEQVYDYQMGSLPMKVGKNKYGPLVEGVRTARMTSFGTAAGAPGNFPEFLFPQFAGPFDAWFGQSFTGEPLTYPDWWPEEDKRRLPIPPDERHVIGLGALLESSIPFASAFRRAVLEKGAPAEPYSTILAPATRKKWDKETKQYTENKGTMLGGILEWLSPYSPKQRLYTYGAGKSIEEAGITGETLERWRKQPRRATAYGFGGGSAVSPDEDDGFNNRGLSKRKESYGF